MLSMLGSMEHNDCKKDISKYPTSPVTLYLKNYVAIASNDNLFFRDTGTLNDHHSSWRESLAVKKTNSKQCRHHGSLHGRDCVLPRDPARSEEGEGHEQGFEGEHAKRRARHVIRSPRRHHQDHPRPQVCYHLVHTYFRDTFSVFTSYMPGGQTISLQVGK